MSVAQANLTKTKYMNMVIDCVPKASGEFNKLTVESVKTSRYEGRVKVAGSVSMGNTEEGASFPAPSSPTTLTTFTGFTVYAANYQITDVAKEMIDGSADNFDSAMKYLAADAMDQTLLYREAFLYGNGTAEVGTVASTNSTTNVRVVAYASGRSINSSVLLMPGAVLDVYSSTLATYRGQMTISYTNIATQATSTAIDVVVPDFPAGTTTGDRLFWASTGQSSYGLAPQGLDSLIDNSITGTFQGVDMTTSQLGQRWTSVVNSNSGTLRALSPTILNNVLQAQAEVYTGRSIDNVGSNLFWIFNEAQAAPFYNMFPGSAAAATPFVTRPDDQAVGNGARTFNGPLGTIKLNFRRECPQPTGYGVDFSNIIKAERSKLHWRDPNMFQLNPNAATSLGQLYEIFQLVVKERRHQVKIADLTYTITNGARG